MPKSDSIPREKHMLTKCDFKMENGACLIVAPENRDILPGCMMRSMVANLERRYQLMEYSSVIGAKAAEEMEDVIGIIELKSSFFQRLTGKQEYCVFQRLHPSLYDDCYVQLSEEEQQAFRDNLDEGDEFILSDYTVSIPPSYFVAVMADECTKIIEILDHLKLRNFSEVRDAVATICEGSISIFDEVELLAEYNEEDIPDLLTYGLEDWLNPPEHVDSLNI